MLNMLKVLNSHGTQYVKNLRTQPVSHLFRGRPVISGNISDTEIKSVASVCPVNAIDKKSGSVDLGRCVFCNECSFMQPEFLRFTNDYRIATNRREALLINPGNENAIRIDEERVRKDVRRLFKGALKLREVSAGGDNSCEMELAAAGNVNFDFGRFGIEFVASPRHADGVVITGPLTENMAEALNTCYNAIPTPRIIILAGTDAISSGIFEGSPALNRKFIDENYIDLFVPGNPVHPLTFINGVMDLLGIYPLSPLKGG
jgi:Ni,Fe-hydrogenase III small subunit